MIELKLIPVEQPIGTLYIGKIETKDLLKISVVKTRFEYLTDGYQRNLDKSRAINITDYLSDPDATFPTSIILAMNSKSVDLYEDDTFLTVKIHDEENDIAEVIDGQHRISGLKNNPSSIRELPIVVLFDLNQEEKAYIFSVINSNQRQVPKSLIYDLFDVYQTRSPNKTCHYVVKALNSNESSPFYRRIKMLGKKASESESLSQGTFVNYICRFITNDSDRDGRDIKNGRAIQELDTTKYVLRKWFSLEKDAEIYLVLKNYFSAAKEVFSLEWDNTEEYILTKTTGFGALCKAFPSAFSIGIAKGILKQSFFVDLFVLSKESIKKANKKLISSDFGSGESAQKGLSKLIIEDWKA